MAIKMVREPSETQNISNIDDIIGLRYAYGNQNGYVIGRGKEISHTINGSNFTVNSGRIVLQGVESDIDANGVTIQVDNIASLKYYTIYCEVNLITNSSTIKSVSDNITYPVIDKGNDLTENSKGIARLALYHFTALNGLISNIEKIIKPIEYIDKNTKVNNAVNSDNATTAENSKKINNLDIKRNVNDVLTVNPESENTFIPQRRLVWTGEAYCNSRTFVNLDIDNISGNNFEIIVKETGPANFQHKILFYEYEGQFLYTQQHPEKDTEVTFQYISIIKLGSKFQGRGVAFNARTNTRGAFPFYVIAIYKIIE